MRCALFVLLLLPAAAFCQESCEPDADLVIDASCLEASESDESPNLHTLLASAQRAWLEYREANCAVFGYRTDEAAMRDAQAQCWAFMTREREWELELLKYVIDQEDHGPGC